LDAPPPVQVFACDLNEDAIQIARAGHYPSAISTDVSEERLRRFFAQDAAGYRVRREVREVILFATHDMIKDAPFSRMDLISCRNLLIYLGRDAQQRLLETFHFALRPGGKLFLGTSESVDEANPLFKVLDKKSRIYVQQPVTRGGVPVPVGPTTLLRTIQAHDQNLRSAIAFGKPFDTQPLEMAAPPAHVDRAELHFKMLEQLAPPSVLVDADHRIVHLSERAGRFIKIAGGEPTLDLLRIVDPVLRADLRAALFRATETNGPIDAAPIVTDVAGEKRAVVMRVTPAAEIAAGYLLVVFETRAEEIAQTEESAPVPPDTVLRSLERELERAKEQLRSNVEQYEASNEELKASNEELQAMNEELRSASEELESSREELQSINEELTTVNTEMKGRMDELASANSDLQNLMASTAIATVFLDRQLTIMRYTPPAVQIFNLIPGDIGRPLAHLKHKLDYPNLIADAEGVQKTLVPVERNVTDGTRWFQARMQPYRTLEDQIGGVVLTLVDVSERNRVTQALRVSEERLQLIIDSAKEYAIFTMDPQRRIVSWSAGAQAAFGWKDSEIIGQLGDVLFASEDRDAHRPEDEMNRARDESGVTGDRWYTRKDGTTFFGSGSMMPLREGSSIVGYVNILRDLTKSKPIEDALRSHVEELTRFNAAAVGRETRMI
ncbi:MAG TPA: CheR family methyltransferase, partial [Polyangiaceae bacterium]